MIVSCRLKLEPSLGDRITTRYNGEPNALQDASWVRHAAAVTANLKAPLAAMLTVLGLISVPLPWQLKSTWQTGEPACDKRQKHSGSCAALLHFRRPICCAAETLHYVCTTTAAMSGMIAFVSRVHGTCLRGTFDDAGELGLLPLPHGQVPLRTRALGRQERAVVAERQAHILLRRPAARTLRSRLSLSFPHRHVIVTGHDARL